MSFAATQQISPQFSLPIAVTRTSTLFGLRQYHQVYPHWAGVAEYH